MFTDLNQLHGLQAGMMQVCHGNSLPALAQTPIERVEITVEISDTAKRAADFLDCHRAQAAIILRPYMQPWHLVEIE